MELRGTGRSTLANVEKVGRLSKQLALSSSLKMGAALVFGWLNPE
jgi:hypothetical protein